MLRPSDRRRSETAFQINEPPAVKIKKRLIGNLAIPAGTEIKLRTTGRNLPQKAVELPCPFEEPLGFFKVLHFKMKNFPPFTRDQTFKFFKRDQLA